MPPHEVQPDVITYSSFTAHRSIIFDVSLLRNGVSGMRPMSKERNWLCSCDSCVQSYLPFWIAHRSFITYISLQGCYHSNLLFKCSFPSKLPVWTALQSEMHEKTELESKEAKRWHIISHMKRLNRMSCLLRERITSITRVLDHTPNLVFFNPPKMSLLHVFSSHYQ